VNEKVLAKLIKEIYIYRKKIHKKEERLRDAKDTSA
jgi:hypothetical protein